ncbi:MAG: PEGA domain-containing protein [Candidatus Metalachnospira sp.]|nr:PEGA domain-containing protein [Candidatus Metalachnospira sp.]
MREYNFDENKNMGETVRIDDIKMKLNEMEELDDSIDDDSEDIEDNEDSDEYDDFGETAKAPVISPSQKTGGGKKSNKPTKNGHADRGKLILIIVVAILAVVLVMVSVALATRTGKNDADSAVENADYRYFYGVVVSVSENKFEVIDTDDGKTSMYTVGQNMTIKLENGKSAAGTSVSRGDIAYFGVSKETDEIQSIEYSDNIWEKNGFEDVEVNADNNTISNGTITYKFDDNAIFMYNGELIDAGDLCSEDVVTLKGIKEKVWAVSVEKYHGFIQLENVDKIEDAEITIDGKKIEFEDNKAAVSAGAHSLGISGSNIDTLTVDIHIAAGEVYSVDMASVQEKTGVLTLNVNVDDCIIVVDGKQVDKDSPVVLSVGTYKVSVSAEGYKTYNGTVEIDKPLVQLDIELEKIVQQKSALTVDSNPQGATVYANNAVIGITPFTAQVDYGEYKITFKKDGYEEYSVNTSVNEEQKSISVLLTEE